MSVAIATATPNNPSRNWNSASLMPRGKDALGNDTLLFGDRPIRADFDSGPRPVLALVDVLDVCGLAKNKRLHLDVRGRMAFAPFNTNGGVQSLRSVDLDDAYRIAMQGKSPACRDFRSFLVELLKQIESGQPINAASPPAVAPTAVGSVLTQAIAALHGVAVELDAQQQRIAANERRVDGIAGQLAQIESRQAEAEAEMRSLPSPTVAAPEKSDVDLTEQLVRFWCRQNSADYSLAYRRLYEEIRRRLSFDVSRRFVKAQHGTMLNVIRMECPCGMGFRDFHAAVYAIACELFPLEPRLAI